jgi:hypothetical protein
MQRIIDDFRKKGWVALILLSAWLIACQNQVVDLPQPTASPESIELPFRTIEQGERSEYQPTEPLIMIMGQSEEVDNLGALISVDAKSELRRMDYHSNLALVVFQGLKYSGGYGVEIKRITKTGNTVQVFADFQAPIPGRPVPAVVTSPYHAVEVLKEGIFDDVVTFEVIVDETMVVSISQFVG